MVIMCMLMIVHVHVFQVLTCWVWMSRSSRVPLYREFISILGGMQVVTTWTPSLIRARLKATRRTVSISY